MSATRRKPLILSENTVAYLTADPMKQIPPQRRERVMKLVEDVIGEVWEIDQLPALERLAAYDQLEHFAGGRADDLRRQLGKNERPE